MHGRPPDKAAGAFRTIGELSRETGLPQHILRYWETRFPQLRRCSARATAAITGPTMSRWCARSTTLLNQEGYTIRGVQKLLAEERRRRLSARAIETLRAIRDLLADALAEDVRRRVGRRTPALPQREAAFGLGHVDVRARTPLAGCVFGGSLARMRRPRL